MKPEKGCVKYMRIQVVEWRKIKINDFETKWSARSVGG